MDNAISILGSVVIIGFTVFSLAAWAVGTVVILAWVLA